MCEYAKCEVLLHQPGAQGKRIITNYEERNISVI